MSLHKAGFSPYFLFGSSPGHATLGTLGLREQLDVVAVGVVVWVANTGIKIKRDSKIERFNWSRPKSWAGGVYTRGLVSRYKK